MSADAELIREYDLCVTELDATIKDLRESHAELLAALKGLLFIAHNSVSISAEKVAWYDADKAVTNAEKLK